MSFAVENRSSQVLRDAICSRNVEQISQILDEASEPYCMILIEVLRGGRCSIIPIIIRYLAPCDALLAERCCYQRNDPFARQFINQAYDVFAFTVEVVLDVISRRNASYEGTKQQEICQLLLERGAPPFQGLIRFNKCELERLLYPQQLQALVLHKEMLQTIGLKHEKAMKIAYKKELAFEYDQHLQTADHFATLATFSKELVTVCDAQNRHVHLELISEALASLQGQQIAEFLFLSKTSNSGTFLQEIKLNTKHLRKALLKFSLDKNSKKQSTLHLLRIEKHLSSLEILQKYVRAFEFLGEVHALSVICRKITSFVITSDKAVCQYCAKYMLNVLETLTKEHIDVQITTHATPRPAIVEELKKIIDSIQLFINIIPHVENIEARVAQLSEKIGTYIVALENESSFLKE